MGLQGWIPDYSSSLSSSVLRACPPGTPYLLLDLSWCNFCLPSMGINLSASLKCIVGPLGEGASPQSCIGPIASFSGFPKGRRIWFFPCLLPPPPTKEVSHVIPVRDRALEPTWAQWSEEAKVCVCCPRGVLLLQGRCDPIASWCPACDLLRPDATALIFSEAPESRRQSGLSLRLLLLETVPYRGAEQKEALLGGGGHLEL